MTRRWLPGLAAALILLSSVAAAIDLLDTIDAKKWDKEKLLREAADPAVYPQFAKEIEAGEKEVRDAVFSLDLALQYVLGLGERLRRGDHDRGERAVRQVS